MMGKGISLSRNPRRVEMSAGSPESSKPVHLQWPCLRAGCVLHHCRVPLSAQCWKGGSSWTHVKDGKLGSSLTTSQGWSAEKLGVKVRSVCPDFSPDPNAVSWLIHLTLYVKLTLQDHTPASRKSRCLGGKCVVSINQDRIPAWLGRRLLWKNFLAW